MANQYGYTEYTDPALANANKNTMSDVATGASLGTSISPGYGTAIGAVAGLAYGLYSANKVAHKPIPENVATQQLIDANNRAKEAAGYGYTPEQVNAFHQDVSRSNNVAYRLALNRAGQGLAGAAMAAESFNNTGQFNKFWAQNAQMQEQKQRYADGFYQPFQRIADQNVARSYDIYGREQSAAGELVHSGISNALWLLASAENNKKTNPTFDVGTGKSAATGAATGAVTGAVTGAATSPTFATATTPTDRGTIPSFVNKNVSPFNAPVIPDFTTEGSIPKSPYAY